MAKPNQPRARADGNHRQPAPEGHEVAVWTTVSLRITLSKKECSQLYGLLGDRAPFVRNQLHMTRSGSDRVSLTTSQECREVLEAIESGGSSLTNGLLSLKLALTSATPHSS